MKVALTGATGFIGSHILTELENHGDAVRARSEFGWRPTHPSLVEEFREGSYRNE